MHDSDNNPNKHTDDLDGFEDDFEFDDEDFEFEEDWDDEENLDKIPDKNKKQLGDVTPESQAPLTPPEPTVDPDTNTGKESLSPEGDIKAPPPPPPSISSPIRSIIGGKGKIERSETPRNIEKETVIKTAENTKEGNQESVKTAEKRSPSNSDPLKTFSEPKIKKKKHSFFGYIASILTVLAIGATAYNTLRQSLAPTLMPVIKLATPSNQEKGSDFAAEAQKRINEIREKELADKIATVKNEREAKGKLQLPFEDESNLSNQNIVPPAIDDIEIVQDEPLVLDKENGSVLTPFPVNLDDNSTELPSLEDALERASLDNILTENNVETSQNLEQTEANAEIEMEEMPNPFLSDRVSNENGAQAAVLDDVSVSPDAPDENTLEELVIKSSFDTDNLSAIEDEYLSKTEEIPTKLTVTTQTEEPAAKVLSDTAIDKQEDGKAEVKTVEKEEIHQAVEAIQKVSATKATETEAQKSALAKPQTKEIETTENEKVLAQKPKTVKKAPLWQLRAVRPGHAVLYDKNTGDIEAVEIGDKIKGLGRIKTIAKKHGQWIITGENGIVTQ